MNGVALGTGLTVNDITTKTGFSLSATGLDLVAKTATGAVAIANAVSDLATYGLAALNTLLVSTGIKATTVPAVTLANGAHGGAGATITLQTPIAATVPDNQKVDVNTVKTQAVTCAAGVTVLASVGTAATSTAQTGDSYALANGATGFVAIDTVVDAVKVQTDKLAFTVTNQVDANIQYVNDVAVTGVGTVGNPWGPV